MAGYSIVRLLVRISSLTTFIVGIILNGILAMLVHHHTPKPMQIYSRVSRSFALFFYQYFALWLIFCTLAYALVCVLGWRMHKFVKNRPSGHGTSKYQGKVDEMNRQITLNLIIQAFLPFTIYGPLLFFLVIILFGINVKQLAWIQYYNMLVTVPMFFPPALNPIVTIFTVRHYRKIFLRAIHLVGRVLCCKIAGSLEGTTKTSSFNANGDGTHLPRDAWTQRNK